MYKVTEESKKTANQIVENMNDISKAKGKKNKDYLSYGKAVVNLKMPSAGTDVGADIGKYAEKQVKEIKASGKKVKSNITDMD